jgi:alkaline phosphatase D
MLQLGAQVASRDRAICNAAANAGAGCTTNITYFPDSAKYTNAFGLDAEWGGFRLYETIRRHAPDFFIHSGDQIYADNPIVAEVKTDVTARFGRT